MVSAKSRLRCAQSSEWRAASNIISCAWAQVTTRASAGRRSGRLHHGMGAVRLRAAACRGFGGIGAAPGRAATARPSVRGVRCSTTQRLAGAASAVPSQGGAARSAGRWMEERPGRAERPGRLGGGGGGEGERLCRPAGRRRGERAGGLAGWQGAGRFASDPLVT